MTERKRKWDIEDPSAKAQASSASSALDPTTIASRAAERINAALVAKGLAPKPAVVETITEEIEINDSPNRFYLTKGTTHAEIHQQTGVSVITKGVYVSPGSQPPPNERPLFLRLTAKDRESIEKALERIRDLMKVKTTTSVTNAEKVYFDVDAEEARSIGFNLCGKILGPKGAYIKHIASEAGAKVILKGRGSGLDGQEATEPLHMAISSNRQENVTKARGLAENLASHIKTEFEEYRRTRAAAPPPPPAYPSAYPRMPVPPGYPAYQYLPYGMPPPPPEGYPPPPPPPYGYPSYPPAAYPPYPPQGYAQGYGYPAYPPVPMHPQPPPPPPPSTEAEEPTDPNRSPPKRRKFSEHPTVYESAYGNAGAAVVGPSRPSKEEFDASVNSLPEPPSMDEDEPPTMGLGYSSTSHISPPMPPQNQYQQAARAKATPTKTANNNSIKLVDYEEDKSVQNTTRPQSAIKPNLPFWAAPDSSINTSK